MKPTAATTAPGIPRPQNAEEIYIVAADALVGLPAVIREIALLFDGARGAREVAAAAQISEGQCAAIIKKLTAMGVLHRSRGRRPTRPAPAHFSAEEEAFFAADVPAIDECNEPFESLGDRIRAAVCEVIVRLQGQRSIL